MADNETLKGLMESIRFVYGYDFTEYAEASLKRRVDHFAEANKIDSLSTLGKALLKEEAFYSIAILLKEEGLLKRSVIYATDINQKALQTAREGAYPIDNMRSYTTNYIKAGGTNDFSDYYIAKYNSVLLDRSLKQNIVFSVHNLAVDKSFNEFQLILCRNVLIYFNQDLQNKVIKLFYESLCPFGFLALGNKESLLFAEQRKNFEEVDKKEKIFMKTN